LVVVAVAELSAAVESPAAAVPSSNRARMKPTGGDLSDARERGGAGRVPDNDGQQPRGGGAVAD
jgi:hypothetical protein